MQDRTQRLEDQVRRLREVLNQRQTVLSQPSDPTSPAADTPILPPPPQRWGPEDGVPAFSGSPIEQLSGESMSRSASVEPWPYSPQNPYRRAGR